MSWQYNGIDKFSTIIAWCYRHLHIDDWETNGYETILFRTKQAQVLFLLKWG